MIKVIFWDFDGVLIASNAVRDLGFERVLAGFPREQIDELLLFHQTNGGLSRYVKFRYFFEKVRGESITDEQVFIWSERFSIIMKELLVDSNLLILETVNFVKENQGKYIMHITSGSDQDELRYICKNLEIDHLFRSIHGSPKPKKEWVGELIKENNYNREECLLIGDSINDWEAAKENRVNFIAYNNYSLSHLNSFNSIF